MLKRFRSIVLIVIGLALASFLYVSHQISFSHGQGNEKRNFRVNPGENVFQIGEKLESQGFISHKEYFVFYMWKESLRKSILAGDYVLTGTMAIPEIARVVIQGDVVSRSVTITFPEGWDSTKVADRLNANGLPGQGFLELVLHPKPEWRTRFSFLSAIPQDASLEGFLFPDTYTFAKDASAEDIVVKMLQDFDTRVSDDVRAAISKQGRTLFEVVTMASVVENEVQTSLDRKMVADIFWRRIAIGQPLQSDATIKYILKKDKFQHSIEETRTESPYNTYIHKGLPPGPIANPGLDALAAAISPEPNPYFYFLTDRDTGETVFAKTFEEHKINKQNHGL